MSFFLLSTVVFLVSGAAINGLGLQNPYILVCNSLIVAQNILSLYSLGNLNLFTTVDIVLQISVIVSISRLYHLLSTQELKCLLEPPSSDTLSPEQEIDIQTAKACSTAGSGWCSRRTFSFRRVRSTQMRTLPEETSPFMPPTTVQDPILTVVLVTGILTCHQPSFEAKQHNKDPAPVKNNHTTCDEKLNTQRFYLFPNVDSTHYQTPKTRYVDYLKNETLVHPFVERTRNIRGKLVL